MNESTLAKEAGARLRYLGVGGELFGIMLVNLLLMFPTLGIFQFWGKTRVRRYVWSHASFDNERLEYLGTGGELFVGFLKALAFIVPLFIVFGLLNSFAAGDPVLAILSTILFYAVAAYLGLAGFYAARRYRLSRTRWRGIRFALEGSAWTFANLGAPWLLLAFLTFGLTYPIFRARTLSYNLNHTSFGTMRFEGRFTGGELFGAFFKAWLLSLVAAGLVVGLIFLLFSGAQAEGSEMDLVGLIAASYIAALLAMGLIWIGYFANEYRYIIGRTRLAPLAFQATYTTGGVYGMWIANLLVLGLTLGLGYAWVLTRVLRFVTGHLMVQGSFDPAAIAQSQAAVPGTGEGLAAAMDVGDIGM